MNMKYTIALLTIMIAAAGCGKMTGLKHGQESNSQVNDSVPTPTNPIVGGDGSTVPGKGALSVPTADGVVARIQNGLEKSVSSTTGNFARALTQVKGNLPKVTNPLKATGYDQIQLLAYAACSDLTTGTTPIMQSRYNINRNGTIASNQQALIAAGVRMLDKHVAGLASQSEASVKVNAALTKLVQDVAAGAGNTATIAFMSVCIAANTAGSSMMGF